MGFVGNWISGHSGTAQKNKKVFARKSQWAKGRPPSERPDGGKVVGRYVPHYRWGGFSELILGVLFFLFAGAGYWWHTGMTSNSSSEKRVIETKREGFSDEEQHAYNFLVTSGRESLAEKEYRVASYEFNEALKIAPYGKQARLGLVETLKEMCAENSYYCDRAEEQLVFVEKMGWSKEE